MYRKPETAAEITRAILVERFPNCFMPKRAEKKPLAIGIQYQIFAAAIDLSRRSVRLALKDYCNGLKYWRNATAGATRVNLDGSPAGVVTDEQAKFMAETMIKAEARWARERKNRKRPPRWKEQKKAA